MNIDTEDINAISDFFNDQFFNYYNSPHYEGSDIAFEDFFEDLITHTEIISAPDAYIENVKRYCKNKWDAWINGNFNI